MRVARAGAPTVVTAAGGASVVVDRDGWASAYACVNCGANRPLSDACFLVRPDFTRNGLIKPAVYSSDAVVSPGWNAASASSTVKSFVPLARSS